MKQVPSMHRGSSKIVADGLQQYLVPTSGHRDGVGGCYPRQVVRPNDHRGLGHGERGLGQRRIRKRPTPFARPVTEVILLLGLRRRDHHLSAGIVITIAITLRND